MFAFSSLTSLFVHGVMSAPFAILLQLDTIGIVLLVLLGRVIAALALGAGQGDQRTHTISLLIQKCFSLKLYTKLSIKDGACGNRLRLTI
jgi:hypothetical protein